MSIFTFLIRMIPTFC